MWALGEQGIAQECKQLQSELFWAFQHWDLSCNIFPGNNATSLYCKKAFGFVNWSTGLEL